MNSNILVLTFQFGKSIEALDLYFPVFDRLFQQRLKSISERIFTDNTKQDYFFLVLFFFILFLDVVKTFAALEELFRLGMSWDKLRRVAPTT